MDIGDWNQRRCHNAQNEAEVAGEIIAEEEEPKEEVESLELPPWLVRTNKIKHT